MKFKLAFQDGTLREAEIGPFKPFNAVLSSVVKDVIASGYTYDKVLASMVKVCHYNVATLKKALDTASALGLVGIYLNPPNTSNLAHGNEKFFLPLDLTDEDQVNAGLARFNTYTEAKKRV